MNDELIKRLNAIYKEFGDSAQRLKLQEECEEYIDSLMYSENQGEEIADVFILSAQLVLNNPEIMQIVNDKLDRTEQRIKDGYYK